MGITNKFFKNRFSIDDDDIDDKYRLRDDDEYNPFLEKQRRTETVRSKNSRDEETHIIKDGSSTKYIDTLNPEKHHHDPLVASKKAKQEELETVVSDSLEAEENVDVSQVQQPIWSKPIQDEQHSEVDELYKELGIDRNISTTPIFRDSEEDSREQKRNISASMRETRANNQGRIWGIILISILCFLVVFPSAYKARIKGHSVRPTSVTLPTKRNYSHDELKVTIQRNSVLSLSRQALVNYLSLNSENSIEEINEVIDECVEEGSLDFYEYAVNYLRHYRNEGLTEEEQRERLEVLLFTEEEIEHAFKVLDGEA